MTTALPAHHLFDEMSSSMIAGGVLHVTVHYVYHPVTEEVLHQVFEAYGVVQISVSERADHVEAEVQIRTRNGAAQALALHGRCIYERSCLLDIQDLSPAAPPAKSDMGELCDLFDKMSMSLFNTHMRSLLELKQTRTVVEYTAVFWERLHPVLDLNPNLNIKCFVQQYVEGLRDDIQAAVRSRSPSSITCASCLVRIREDEILEDRVSGADKLGISSGFTPTETLTDVFPELAAPVQCMAGHDITTIDGSCRGSRTPTTCSTECPSSDATVGVFPMLAVSTESDDLDTVSIAQLKPAACSTGGLAHACEGKDIFPASIGCIIMAPTSCSALCLQNNNDKHITTKLKLAWLYSARALLSKWPRCRELLYVNGNLKLFASYWKSSGPQLPGNDWFLGYSGTDLVVEKNCDPGINQRTFLNNINLHGTYEVKFPWVLSKRRYAAYQWDPGILVGILHVPNLPCCQRVLIWDGLFNALSYGSSKCFFPEVQWVVLNCLCTSLQTDGNQCKCDWRRRCLLFAILVFTVKYLNEFVIKLRTNPKLVANNFDVVDLLSRVQDIHLLLKLWPYYVLHLVEPCSFCLAAQVFVAMGRLASEGWHQDTHMDQVSDVTLPTVSTSYWIELKQQLHSGVMNTTLSDCALNFCRNIYEGNMETCCFAANYRICLQVVSNVASKTQTLVVTSDLAGLVADPNYGMLHYSLHQKCSCISKLWATSQMDKWPKRILNLHDIHCLQQKPTAGTQRRQSSRTCWPWDPGGSCHSLPGLGTSRILRGRECHTLSTGAIPAGGWAISARLGPTWKAREGNTGGKRLIFIELGPRWGSKN